jgi:hypothetical protein
MESFSKGASAAEAELAIAANFDAYDGRMRWTVKILDPSEPIEPCEAP